MKLRKTELWAIVLTGIFLAAALGYRLGARSGEAEVRVSAAVLQTFAPALPAPAEGEGAPAEGPGPAAEAAPVNLNTATAEELKSLTGVGDALAARIIEDREANGPFGSVEDITRVSGVGRKVLDSNRDRMYVGQGLSEAGDNSGPAPQDAE